MHTVNIHEAKTNLSALLKRVESGEEVIVARSGRPIARIVGYHAERRRIAPPGSMANTGAWISDDFDDPVDSAFDSLGEQADALA